MEQEKYLTVTPMGALHAVKDSSTGNVTRKVLLNIFKQDDSPILNEDSIRELTGIADLRLAQAVMYQLQVMHFVQAEPVALAIPKMHLEKDLPTILGLLSSTGKSLLSDSHGLQLGNVGFPEKSLEELAAASSRLSEVYRINERTISEYVNNQHSCIGIMNSQGLNQLGVFSLNVGQSLFTLTIGGIPFLNQRAFRDLVWVLVYRYGVRV